MSEPLLLTKLFVPPTQPNRVLRPRLIERLNEGLRGKLTLISAPAGFGKTTLVSEWVAESERMVAWLSVDEGDNDPTRFLIYLIAALQQTIRASLGAGVLGLLQSPQPPPLESILITLTNEIATLPDPLIFVLDDYHSIDSKPVDVVLAFLLEKLQPQMHLVITTREDPHLPLARFRARGQLTELRAADLRFTPAEAAEFLNRVMGLTLSDEDIAALETRTEGWIAGLQLAALSMQGRQDTVGFVQAFTGNHRFVLDYLLEEVLQRQPENIQTFLLLTSILDRLCGPLCDAVLSDTLVSRQEKDREDIGQDTLEQLERANLFIVALDNERRWYRYHHLFRDILRQRLGQRLTAARIAEFHLRASRWYETNGDETEAFHHALSANDFERAACLAEAGWQEMDNRFQTAAWLRWVKKLPENTTRNRPLLSAQMAQTFSDGGDPEASEACLQDAERCLNGANHEALTADQTQLEHLPAMIALTRANNAHLQGDLSNAIRYSELALQLIPESDFFRRAMATITLQVTRWTLGDLEAARSALDDWMTSTQKAGNYVFYVASAFALADILVALGRIREAVRTYQRVLQIAVDHGPETQSITAHHYLGLALLSYEMGEDTTAAGYMLKAEEMGKQTTLVDWPYRWHIAQAWLKETDGDLESALGQLDAARRAYVKTSIPDIRPVEALKARVFLKQGRLDKAQAWARARGLATGGEINYLNEFEYLTLVRVRTAEYHDRQGESSLLPEVGLLERLLKAAETQKRAGSILEILVTQALVYQAQNNLPLALASLERAMALAEPEGYLRLFVHEGEAMRSLVEIISRNPEHAVNAYADNLLAAFALPATAPKLSRLADQRRTPAQPKTQMVESLSERELEVLKLLRTELSGPEIAAQLVVSLNTFRTHTRNIFSKLEANNRRSAVRRAEELGLF